MATKKKANGPSPAKRPKKPLKKTDEAFYSTIGSLGGRGTLKAKGPAHFSRMAKIRHQRNREKKLLDGKQ